MANGLSRGIFDPSLPRQSIAKDHGSSASSSGVRAPVTSPEPASGSLSRLFSSEAKGPKRGDLSLRSEPSDPDNEEWGYRTGQEVAVEELVFVEGERGLVAVGAAAHARLDLTLEEVCIVQNALNEVCNGLDLQNEFENRIGALSPPPALSLNVLPQSEGSQECKRQYGNYDCKKAKRGVFSFERAPLFSDFRRPGSEPDHN